MTQNSFLQIAMRKKKLKCERFLNEMQQIIPWKELIKEIAPYYQGSDIGRRKTQLELLLKIYFLQQWYNLSDPGAEEAIYDRNSFQLFLKIDLLSRDTVPDETTILNFRHLLEKNKLQEIFLEIVNQKLDEHKLILREGTIVDATIINAPSSTKNKDKKRDKEMSSTKKNNTWYFGMKAHIGVDSKNGIIHTVKTSTAKEHDKCKYNDLLHGEEKIIIGDKGYYDEKEKKKLRKENKVCAILDKGKRGHKLSHKQKKRNKKIASVRAKVEHPFQVIKCRWNYTKVRYKGLLKNTMQLNALFALVNLYRMRKKLIHTTP